MKKLQGGGFLVLNGDTENVLAEFDDIETLGQVFGMWGYDESDDIVNYTESVVDKTGQWIKLPDKDPKTGLDTPETAAIREKIT